MVEVLYVSAAETKELLGLDDALAVIERVSHWIAAGREIYPQPRIYSLPMKEFHSNFRIKAAALPEMPVAGVRVTASYSGPGGLGSGAPDNTRFVLLTDPRNAQPLAIIDEHWTYNVRTCAAGMLSLRYLAKPEPKVAAMIGAGVLATTCVELLGRLFPLAEIRVTSRRAESREAFARKMTDLVGIPVEPRPSIQEAMEGADLVISCTSSDEYLVFDEWLDKGAVLLGLGSEVHPDVYRAVDKVVVSDLDVVREAVDVRKILQEGQFTEEEIWSDLPSIVAGRKPGRESPDERILVRSSGLVSHDIAIAHFVYQAALERGKGIRLPVG